MTYTRNTSILYKYSRKKKFYYQYGITQTTNLYKLWKRSRFLFIKSNLQIIYYYDVLFTNYIGVFNLIKLEQTESFDFFFLKIIYFYAWI